MSVQRSSPSYRELPFFCESALPAADFDFVPVRPSRSVDDAFVAALAPVFLRVPVCDSALPAADFDFAPVLPLRITLDDFVATFALVFLVAM